MFKTCIKTKHTRENGSPATNVDDTSLHVSARHKHDLTS